MFSAVASSSGMQASLWSNIIVFCIFVSAAYFFLIRPQQKKIEEHRSLIKSLKVGDTIVTIGGVVGQISKINDRDINIITLGTEIKVAKYAISELSETELKPVKNVEKSKTSNQKLGK